MSSPIFFPMYRRYTVQKKLFDSYEWRDVKTFTHLGRAERAAREIIQKNPDVQSCRIFHCLTQKIGKVYTNSS